MSDEIVSTIVDHVVRDRAARWLGQAGVQLPTFAELAEYAHANRVEVRDSFPANGLKNQWPYVFQMQVPDAFPINPGAFHRVAATVEIVTRIQTEAQQLRVCHG